MHLSRTPGTRRALAAPGRNALDALVLGYQAAGALRELLPPGDQVHGAITDGGGPPNVVPARAAAAFMVRSVDADGLARALDRTAACFTGAAAATGCRAHVRLAGPVYRELRPDSALARAYHRHLLALGRSPLRLGAPGRTVPGGSTDMGNVSQLVPAIHPMLAIAPADVASPHTPAFASGRSAGRRPRRAGRGQGAGHDRPRPLGRGAPGAPLSGPTRPALSAYRPVREDDRSWPPLPPRPQLHLPKPITVRVPMRMPWPKAESAVSSNTPRRAMACGPAHAGCLPDFPGP